MSCYHDNFKHRCPIRLLFLPPPDLETYRIPVPTADPPTPPPPPGDGGGINKSFWLPPSGKKIIRFQMFLSSFLIFLTFLKLERANFAKFFFNHGCFSVESAKNQIFIKKFCPVKSSFCQAVNNSISLCKRGEILPPSCRSRVH